MFRPRLSTLLIAAVVLLPLMALIPVKNAGVIQEHDFPPALSPGEEQVVTWSLDIHGCEGFARFQIQFPEGISAQPRETANASYSFEDGKAKFIWMELPAQSTLQIALAIQATPEFSGGTVTHWFSFIQNGSRKDIEFEPHHVARRSDPPLPVADASPASSLQVQRTWRPTSDDAGTMTVQISGHESGQFLKLTESIGNYQNLSVLEDNDCQIRDAFDGKLVCIWQAAPADDLIEVRYTLKGGQPEQVQGIVSTVFGDAPKEAIISPLSTAAPAPLPEQVAVAPTEPEIAFRVQVLATRSEVSTGAVQRIYAFPGELRMEQHDDWHKFTTGYHTTYRSARDNRVALRKNHAFPGPFVAAYQNGKRITVQEALLVTKQNWIP